MLETLDRPAVLVGHSIGGRTIQTLLRDRSALRGRISGVVLLNTTFTNPLRTIVFSRTLLALQKPLLEPAMRVMILAHPIAWLSKWQSYLSGGTHAAMRLGFGVAVTRHPLDHTALLATKAPPAIESRGNLALLYWDAEGRLRRRKSRPWSWAGISISSQRLKLANGSPGRRCPRFSSSWARTTLGQWSSRAPILPQSQSSRPVSSRATSRNRGLQPHESDHGGRAHAETFWRSRRQA